MTSRILELRSQPDTEGTCVLYVMARDQRMCDNHALLEAQKEAIEHTLPLLVVFNLLPSTGHRRREHYEFMVNGLKEVEADLRKKNIPFIVTIGSARSNVAELCDALRPRSIYFDFSPLRGPRANQKHIAKVVRCRVAVVDTHNVVPAWVTSDKEEFAAHTIRRKLHALIEDWAKEPGSLQRHPHSFTKVPTGETWKRVEKLVKNIPKNDTDHGFAPGEAAAKRKLSRFIESGLVGYATDRNNALKDAQSDLSPYLHFGQLSSLRILLDIMDKKSHPPQLFTSYKLPVHGDEAHERNGIDSFVEELIVRKELADNYCFYNANYDSLQGAKDWAKKTLEEHKDDHRDFIYTKQQLEDGQTHDELWNAVQMQLRKTGKIHGYLRMYWAKKILEWTNSPSTAISWTIELNDTYHLDGGDPNGYVGVLWSIAGLHDRPWFDRAVYGTIRYMAQSGAQKRFDTKKYIERWQNTK